MAMKINGCNTSVKVEGDLGDLQITELSDSEDDNANVKQNASKTISTLSKIPPSLVQTSSVPVFGSVAVSNSDNVQFGNNTYFNGPVTIKQVIQKKSGGVDNESYCKTDDENTGDRQIRKPKLDIPVRKEILVWHKLTFSAVCISVIGGIIAIILVLQNKGEKQSNISNAQPDTSSPESSLDPTVVGYYGNFQVIFISVILFPITFLLISYSLLTREASNAAVVVKKNKIHENCVDKACTICNEEVDPLLIAPDFIRIISRTDWLAQPVEGELDKLTLPAPWVIITHTATESCNSQSQCVLRVRLIQTFHIESRGWDDIGYNFLVGGDGSVYFGRGWDYEGAHTRGYNKYSIGIAFIGTFNNDPPPKQQIEACEKIIRQGVQLGKLTKDYKLFAHRQLMSTLSPGDKLFDIIKEWPHFVKNDSNILDLIPKRGLKTA